MLGGTAGHTQYFYTESMKEEADVLAEKTQKEPTAGSKSED